jgi:hypothetical protein
MLHFVSHNWLTGYLSFPRYLLHHQTLGLSNFFSRLEVNSYIEFLSKKPI